MCSVEGKSKAWWTKGLRDDPRCNKSLPDSVWPAAFLHCRILMWHYTESIDITRASTRYITLGHLKKTHMIEMSWNRLKSFWNLHRGIQAANLSLLNRRRVTGCLFNSNKRTTSTLRTCDLMCYWILFSNQCACCHWGKPPGWNARLNTVGHVDIQHLDREHLFIYNRIQLCLT